MVEKEVRDKFTRTVFAACKRLSAQLLSLAEQIKDNQVSITVSAVREAGDEKIVFEVKTVKYDKVSLSLTGVKGSDRWHYGFSGSTDLEDSRNIARVFPLLEEMAKELEQKLQQELDKLRQQYEQFIEEHKTERIVEEL